MRVAFIACVDENREQCESTSRLTKGDDVSEQPNFVVDDRFADALQYAYELHRQQGRKGSGIPYLGHLLGVCSLILEAGGDEDQAIAGLLHDGPEDQGGRATLKEIRHRFGGRVADIVEACS